MGRKPNNYEDTFNTFDQVKYERLLSETNEFIKVKAIDTEKTIHLISKIKGNRSVKDFAFAVGTISRIQLFRIFRKRNIELRNTTIAGILSSQLPESNVSLDAFMEAQGKIRKEELDNYKKIHNIEIRQILEYTLIMAGCEIKAQEEYKRKKFGDDDQSKFTIKIRQQCPTEYIWDFEIMSFPFTEKKTDYVSIINTLLSHLVTVSVTNRAANRFSIIIDNELVYRELKEKAETIRLPNEVSIILISTFQRKVIEEYIISLSRTNLAPNLFTEVEIPTEKSMYYTLEEKYKIDCRSIILDDLLQKGYTIRHANAEKKVTLFNFINLRSDFSILVTEDDFTKNPRIFFIKDITDYTDYSMISQSIHDWLLQIIVCFYTGRLGDRDMVSLVVNNPTFYKNITDEFISSHISDQISAILINTDKRRMIDEKNIPILNRKKTHNEIED